VTCDNTAEGGHKDFHEGTTNVIDIEELYQKYKNELIAFLTYRLRSAAEAEEVAQEAYTRMLQSTERRSIERQRFRLFRIAANLATDRIRHRTRRLRYECKHSSELGAEPNEPETEALMNQQARHLVEYLEELPEKLRNAVLMDADDSKQWEISQKLGVSTRMVRRYISYGLAYCTMRTDGISADEARSRLKL
jgi:RNA polymerase sigma-70 factor (ECF subfamily)